MKPRWPAALALLLSAFGFPLSALPAPPEYSDHQRLLYWLDDAGHEQPVRTPADWQRRREHILLGMQRAMGALPRRDNLPPLNPQELSRVEQQGIVRIQLSLVVDRRPDGSLDRLPAYLLLPARSDAAPRPALLALHQTVPIGKGEPVGLGDRPSMRYGLELARRGYVVLAPDYPSFGDYRYDFAADAYDSGTMKGIVNHLRAVDYLTSRPEVDPLRIGVIGHSLGGHNALFAAAFDPRLKAIVSSCGWTPFHDYYQGKLAGWASARYMPRLRTEFGLDPDRMPFDFYEVVAALAPRPFFSCSPLGDSNFDVAGVRKVERAAREVYNLHGAGDRLRIAYPDCGHDFPQAARDEAYAFLDRALARDPSVGNWKAGLARVKITPQGPLWLAGYAARNRPAEGTLLDLWAKALVLEDPRGMRLVLVTLDLLGLDRELSRAIADEVSAKHKLPRANLALCASHTHSGPVVGRNLRTAHFDVLPVDQQQRIVEYSTGLQRQVVELVGQALADLQPCQLALGQGTATFAVNRRANPEPRVAELRAAGKLQGPVDHDLPVLVVRGADRKPRAVVFGYACHATVLDGYQWCGDYPGYAQQALEAAHPGCTAMFWAGCGGDQNPLPRRKVELAQEYGRQLAQGVEAALKTQLREIDGEARASYREIELPFAALPTADALRADAAAADKYAAARARRLLAEIEAGRPLSAGYPYPVQVWRLGDARWVFLGGEVVVDYALRIKRELGPAWIAGYANDVMAYIPSRRVLAEGGYEGGGAMVYYGLPAPWAPEVEERIIGAVRELSK